MTSEWDAQLQIGRSKPNPRYGHSMILTDSMKGKMNHGQLSSANHPALSSFMEQRKVKMWIVGGSSKSGFTPLHIYELAINPPPCLLEERGRWQRKVSGHWSYQRQRLLVKPFEAWRAYIRTRRRKHVLAEHDDVLAARLPFKSSLQYTSSFKQLTKQTKQREYHVDTIISFGNRYQDFKKAATGRNIRNRVVHLSLQAADFAREQQVVEDEMEAKIEVANRKRHEERERTGTEGERNHESKNASVLENMMASVLLSGPVGGTLSTLSTLSNSSNGTFSSSGRPKSSPGGKRYRKTKNGRPETAPLHKQKQRLRPVRANLKVAKGSSSEKLLPKKEAKFISSTRRKTFFDPNAAQFGIKNAHSTV